MMKFFQRTKTQEELDQEAEERRVEQKLQRITSATQSEKDRKPNPRAGKQFYEEQWLDFEVIQDNQTIRLHTYRCEPKVKPKGLVFAFHGLGAHTNHAGHIAQALCDAGLIVVGFDHRGFGKSQGLKGYLENTDIHLEDSNKFVEMVLNFYSFKFEDKLPVFYMGLSMGGMTSFRLAIQKPWLVKGIILLAPAIKPIQSKVLIGFAKALGSIAPRNQLIKAKKGQATRNPQVSEDHFADPYTYTEPMRPGTLKTILSAMEQASTMFHMLTTPWIVIQGGLDKLVDPDLARDLQLKSPSNDKTVLFYDDCWHDIYHEEEILDAIPKVVDWVSKRV